MTFLRRRIFLILSVFVFLSLLMPVVPTLTSLSAQASLPDSLMQASQGNAAVHSPPQAGSVAVQRELPVRVVHADRMTAATVDAEVTPVDSALAAMLSPVGVAFRLEFPPGEADRFTAAELESLQLEIDYGRLTLPYGGSFAQRLTVVRLSGCREEGSAWACLREEKLISRNDPVTQRLLVSLTEQAENGEEAALNQAAAAQAQHPKRNPDAAESEAAGQLYLPILRNQSGESGAAEDAIYVLTADVSSSAGTYAATPLTNVSSYQVGLFTGAAQTSYPMALPPAAAGPQPAVGLSYDSGRVDGMHSSKNNQPDWAGIGWSYEPGYIVHHLKTCNLPGSYAREDLCATDEYSIVLDGRSSRLVSMGGDSYRLQDDPHWRVERKTHANERAS